VKSEASGIDVLRRSIRELEERCLRLQRDIDEKSRENARLREKLRHPQFDRHRERLAAIRAVLEELDDTNLAFETANEVIGKLFEANERLRNSREMWEKAGPLLDAAKDAANARIEAAQAALDDPGSPSQEGADVIRAARKALRGEE
jgi:chromosome segregation ATPase